MSKHTPGPWEIDWHICREGNEELWRVPRSIGPAHVDHNHWAGLHITVDETDARLIAAAPQLLEALKGLVAYHGAHDKWHKRFDFVFDNARAAIAKAEGRE